jgi:hypothetical protein
LGVCIELTFAANIGLTPCGSSTALSLMALYAAFSPTARPDRSHDQTDEPAIARFCSDTASNATLSEPKRTARFVLTR